MFLDVELVQHRDHSEDMSVKRVARAHLVGLLFLPIAVGACGGVKAAPQESKITIAGSSALVPLLTEAASRYMKQHPSVHVEITAGGSYTGLAKVAAGDVTIGASDVVAEGQNAVALQDHPIAAVGFAAMANQGAFNEGISSLTADELRGIFTGRIKDWSDLGGDDQPITLINREKGSGTRGVFGSLVLGGDLFASCEEQPSSSKVQERLLGVPGSISYLALSYHHEALRTFAYENVAATTENILARTYPLWSVEHLYTKGTPSEVVAEFVGFVASGRFQREVLPGLGFIPVHDMQVTRDKRR
jgi:phosphate transport system substrate-binding protein